MNGLTYAIGDIHGRHDLLVRLLSDIAAHADGRNHRVICLGDYIDRGPDSAGVLGTLMTLQSSRPGEVVCLMGNHEAMLLEAMSDLRAATLWIMNGGDATLASYGVSSPQAVPTAVTEWLATLPAAFQDNRHYFVHAGFRPGRRIDKQSRTDMLWIREAFLDRDYDFGKHVAHGHTPSADFRPDNRPFRTNLDTGAVFGGPLTAGIFDDRQGPPVGFLSVS
ncbi:metallophosphoesterase family protein [Microvirga pudoricolor]|uniref:metallophosphoesterase family protein n=1 Tax=Microvirga pudoricolor TaxID=2778729 RepID=UPI00194EE436|nr:metallophosphoesterase family protein [Microvirga pudoricolor]MBM6592887.1 serine/threonine protein phosphatase [Microvirga pudoricolor]